MNINIILFTNRGGRVLSFEFNPLRIGLLVSTGAVLLCVLGLFEGIVTGASEKGTWARVLSIPVEGKIVRGAKGLDVGQRVRLKLVSVDVDKGFIDFQRI